MPVRSFVAGEFEACIEGIKDGDFGNLIQARLARCAELQGNVDGGRSR